MALIASLLLVLEPELTLVRKMLQLPELVEQAAEQLQPHVLPHYAGQLAGTFHSFYKQCKVVTDTPDDPAELALSKARLKLVAEYSTGFVYLVSRTGVTGERQSMSAH